MIQSNNSIYLIWSNYNYLIPLLPARMSLFLLTEPQLDSILLNSKKTQRRTPRKNIASAEKIQLKEHIENQIRKQREVLGIFRAQNIKTFQWYMNVGSILDRYKTVLGITLNKSKKSIQMKVFFSTMAGTFFRVHNKNKYSQITRGLQFRLEKNTSKFMNICLNMVSGQLAAHFPVCYLFNEFLGNNNLRGESRIFKLFKDNIQQSLPILEKIIQNSNYEAPFGLQETPMKKKIWENIYRYEQMINISSHLNESYIQTEEQITQKDRSKAIDIKRMIKNRQILPNWVLRNTFLFEQCMYFNNCLPQGEKNFYLAHEQLQFIKSMISMPVQPRSRLPYENNLILNHIYVQNINNVCLNKINEGGFSQIFLAEIDYCYVFSSQGHEILYEETNERQNNVLHKYVIVKKDTQFNQSSRMGHEIKVLKHIKNGLSIFLPKYYIVVNKSSALTDSVVMDFIPFKNLREYLRSNCDSMSLATKLHLIFSITQSLRYIRDFRIVHLDLKPNNIMIFCNLLIKLIDFGESYHPEVCTEKHNPGFTIPYSPPEVYKNDTEQFTSKSDVFSLGIIMYEILYNSRPFEVFEDTEEVDSAMKNYLGKWYFLPEEFQSCGDSQILRILNFIISKCISPKPKERPELDWIALIVRQCLELCNS